MTASEPGVDVVVVAHNPGAVLGAALSSAVAQAGAERVVVVDADSTDGSVEAALREAPGVRVMRRANEGFAAATNAGIRETSGRFVLMLNPDAELLEGALAALVARMEAEPRAGIAGAKVLDPDGMPQANAFGRFPSLAEALRLKAWRLAQRARGNTRLSPPDFSRPMRVDWVTGACALARREALDDVGLLDERFFLYYEDVDLCHRLRDAGWEVLVEPSARCVHHLGTSAAPAGFSARAYRESFYRYTEKYGLWGLRAIGRAFAAARRVRGGA